MPVGRRADFFLGGKPFMLARGQFKGRAWNRTGLADTPSRRSDTDAKYGILPDTIDHPEVFDDWSGGFGHAYRRQGENTYHWAENFDARFPRQLVHAQQLVLTEVTTRSTILVGANCENFLTIPTSLTASSLSLIQDRWPTVWFYGQKHWGNFHPDVGTVHIVTSVLGSMRNYYGNACIVGSYVLFGSYPLVSGYYSREERFGLEVLGATGGGLSCFGQIVVGNRIWRSADANPNGSVARVRYLQNATVQAMDAGVLVAGDWSATYTIGDANADIKAMVGLEDQVFVGNAMGLFAGAQEGTFVNVLSELSNQRHPDNCRDLTIYNGAVVAPHIAGIYSYKPGYPEARVQEIGPSNLSNRSPVRGYARAVKGFGKWLYAGLYTGSESYLLAGIDTGQNYIWHTLNRLPHKAKIHRIHFDGITTSSGNAFRLPERMWLATDASIDTGGTAPIYWSTIPFNNGNPLATDPVWSPNYVGSARMDLGNVDWGAPSTPKVYRSVEVWADMLLSGYRYGDIYYDVDHSGTFTLLGRVQTSPKSTLYFSSGEGSFVTGQSIELSLQSFTASPAFTPVYRTIALRGALRPNSVDEITAVVRIAEGIRDREGGEMRSGATMLEELRDFATAGTPTTLIDVAGAANYVNVLAPIQEQEVYQVGEDNPEIAAVVKMAVMTFS